MKTWHDLILSLFVQLLLGLLTYLFSASFAGILFLYPKACFSMTPNHDVHAPMIRLKERLASHIASYLYLSAELGILHSLRQLFQLVVVVFQPWLRHHLFYV